MSGWRITARPIGENEEGVNKSHMLVLLKHAQYGEQEIAAVAFERSQGHYSDVGFDEQLDTELAKAKKAIEVLNGLTAEAGTLR